MDHSCSFEPPRLETVGSLTRVNVPGCATLKEVGLPRLPSRTLKLLIPSGQMVERIEVLVSAPEQILPGRWTVDYGQPPVSSQSLGDARSLNALAGGPNASIYSSSADYPSVRARLQSVQRMSGHDIALVQVFPVRYRPAEGQLTYAPKLTIRLHTTSDSTVKAGTLLGRSSRAVNERIAGFVDNPAMMESWTPGRQGRLTPFAANSVDYLLITKSALVDAFQPLLDRKVEQGLAVEVETVETIGSTYAGTDLAEKIRNRVRDAYSHRNVSYVLLGGDIQTIPCRYAYARMDGLVAPGALIPSDLYYACLDGSWNSDGDDLWGEPTDGEGGGEVDLLAEVFVGRAPVDTAGEAAVFVEKTLRYDTQAHTGVTNALFMAEFLRTFPSGPAQGADMFTPLAPFFQDFQVHWLDDQPFTTPQWTGVDALEALNASPHLALYNGHGDVDLIMRLYTENLDLLTNSSPFLAYSVGCNAGEFDNDKFSPDCIGEELVKRSSAGAFAAILNSREGWYDPKDEEKYSGEFQTQFFDHLLLRGERNIGLANQLARHDLVGQVETGGTIMTYRWCYFEINLLGDPQLAWQVAPSALDESDNDGDGLLAWEEAVAGTDPNDPASVLQLTITPGLRVGVTARLQWPSVAGRVYTVHRSSALGAAFVVVADGLTAAPPLNTWEDTTLADQPVFYRIEVR